MRQQLLKILYCHLLGISSIYAATNNLISVGTTGDYPPLTYSTESGYRGQDIDIITEFAKANKFAIKFVATTWPTLNQDLTSGKFDIAVGGISENPSRKQLFYLSDAIENSAKVPLIRCTDINRFTNFASIDNESTLVVENRGGTNQDFAIQHTKYATLILYLQNYKALASLTDPKIRSDTMFTDDIEAQYQHQINPQLCVADIPEKFPSSNKVFLFPKTNEGYKLNKLFNSWWQMHNSNH